MPALSNPSPALGAPARLSPLHCGDDAVRTGQEPKRPQLLGAPPRDVQRLLEIHNARLPHYLDTQRGRALAAAQQRWALLLAPGPGDAPERP